MKRHFKWIAILYIAFSICGCNKANDEVIEQTPEPPKGASIEGRVLDGTGAPIQNLKIGLYYYRFHKKEDKAEKAETTTGKDGRFRFEGVNPKYTYKCVPKPENWSTKHTKNSAWKITVPLEGEIAVFERDLIIYDALDSEGSAVDPNTGYKRFRRTFAKTVVDSITGLEWFIPIEKQVLRSDAEQIIKRIGSNKGYWRFPTQNELKKIWLDTSVDDSSIDPAFKVEVKGCVWAAGRPRNNRSLSNMVNMGYGSSEAHTEHHDCMLLAVRTYLK